MERSRSFFSIFTPIDPLMCPFEFWSLLKHSFIPCIDNPTMEGFLEEAGPESLEFAFRKCQQTPKAKRLCPNSKGGPAVERTRFCQLPEEVVEEILLKLPAESLKTCRRVCKSWFDLINDPSFVNKHLCQNSKNSRTVFLKWIRQEQTIEDIFSPYSRGYYHANDFSKLVLSLVTICEDDGNGDNLPCFIEQVNLPPIPAIEGEDFPTNFRAFHCNGIIHMFDKTKNWTSILLNPALREFKLVQEPELPLDSNFDEFLGCGFGYDPTTDLYKYVKIFGNEDYEDPVALVHTLGTDCWREIEINVEDNYCFLHSKGVYCKGAYYWENMSIMGNTILSFDMSKEKFRSIPFPDLRLEKTINCFRILELWNESVVFFTSTQCSWFSTSFEMWVMVDNFGGVEGSTYWIKHLKIGPLVCICGPLAFWKEDELLLETRDGGVVSYNLYTRKIRKLPLCGAVYPGFTYASLCIKSLVSV